MFMDPICRAPRRYARRVAAARGRDSRSRSLSSGLRLPVGYSRGRESRSFSSDSWRGRRPRTTSRSRSPRRSRRGHGTDRQDGDRDGAVWGRLGARGARRHRCIRDARRRGAHSGGHRRSRPSAIGGTAFDFGAQAPTSRQHALAFDGELYDRDAFMTYYGLQHGNYMWVSCAERTNTAVSFVQAWLYYIRATGKDQTMQHALLRFLRLQEWAKDFRWKSVLLIYVFRALSCAWPFWKNMHIFLGMRISTMTWIVRL